jgi:cell division transport system ATP-binding protein
MIRFDQVTKTYTGTTRPALNNVSLEVLKGEFVFLVGASGSGKSSFLRLVLKEEKPSKGQLWVLGQQLGRIPARKVPYFRRSLGVVFQDFRLLPNKTAFDNVAFALEVIGKSKGFIQEAVPDVLKMVGLGGKQGRYPHELSGGEQQRVAIARAIVNKPAILLADEPTGNLDPATSAGIMTLLSTVNANGTTVLMATHDSGIVDQMKRRVIELVSGQVVRDERQGGYQTQAVPVQKFELAGTQTAPPATPLSQPITVVTAAPAPAPLTAPVAAPAATAIPPVIRRPVETGASPIADLEATRYRPPRDLEQEVTEPPVSRPVTVPARGSTPAVPPPLNEPEVSE